MYAGIIDLSHNNAVELTAVQQAGFTAVIHKATEGATYQDPLYASRQAEARQLGLLWGAYHFGTAAAVAEQIANFMATANLGAGDLVALDYETNTNDTADTMSLAQAEELVTSFQQQYGYFPLIYGSNLLTAASSQSPQSALGRCGLWIADYTSAAEPVLPALFTQWSLWQFGQTDVSGVSCDHNRFNGTEQELTAAWPMRGQTAATIQAS